MLDSGFDFDETPPLVAHSEDLQWMERALELAGEAARLGEIPVGAVIVDEHGIVAEAHNLKEKTQNPLAHAEILAIEKASLKLRRWRLSGCTLYVTLEPCLMCAGAIIQARVDRVVFATIDAKAGAVHSLYQTLSDARLNHSPQVHAGLLESPARELLQGFFKELRLRKQRPDASL